MIVLDNITKRYGRTAALEGVHLTAAQGDSVALWGANGAGKTTLIRCLLGLISCEGRVLVGGRDVRTDGKSARMLVGYVPQELGFYDDLRLAEALAFFAALKGLGRGDTAGQIDRVGLCGHERKRVRELSGGMKQRLALAMALLGDPPLLVLDEVTASLDACGRGEFVALLSRLSGQGRTMLFASHRVEEVTTLAKRVVILEHGRITREVTAAEFAGTLGGGQALHLTIRRSECDRAMALLRSSGFAVTLNGVGIVVRVPHEQKAAPFRVLAEGRVSVEDFEMLSAAAAGGQEAKP